MSINSAGESYFHLTLKMQNALLRIKCNGQGFNSLRSGISFFAVHEASACHDETFQCLEGESALHSRGLDGGSRRDTGRDQTSVCCSPGSNRCQIPCELGGWAGLWCIGCLPHPLPPASLNQSSRSASFAQKVSAACLQLSFLGRQSPKLSPCHSSEGYSASVEISRQ